VNQEYLKKTYILFRTGYFTYYYHVINW